MAFAARFDGEDLLATFMSDEAWVNARAVGKQDEQRLIISYSGLPGFARTSSNGIRHFAHRKGYSPDIQWSETAEHQALKAALLELIAAHGWPVAAEVPSGPDRDWIADVLATSPDGQRRIAFEVQWSRQSPENYVYRTERYYAAGIEVVWLVRHANKSKLNAELATLFAEVPIFQLSAPQLISESIKNGEPPAASATGVLLPRPDGSGEGRSRPLAEFVTRVLGGQLLRYQSLDISFYMVTCWNCFGRMTCWHLDTPHAVEPMDRPERSSLFRGVAPLILGDVTSRFGPPAQFVWQATTAAMAFACSHCGQPQDPNQELYRLRQAEHIRMARHGEIQVTPAMASFMARWQPASRTQTRFELGSASIPMR